MSDWRSDEEQLVAVWARLIYEEHRAASTLPVSTGGAAEFVTRAIAEEANHYVRRIVGKEVSSRRIRRLQARLGRTLLPMVNAYASSMSAAARLPSAPYERLPLGADAVDDIRGGARVQARMWAERHIRIASRALAERGGNQEMGLAELSAVNAEWFAEFVISATMLSLLLVNDSILALITPSTRPNILRVAKLTAIPAQLWPSASESIQDQHSKAEALVQMMDEPVRQEYEEQVLGKSPTNLERVKERMRVKLQDRLFNPLISRGAVEVHELFDRAYLPLRVAAGASIDPDSGRLRGGPTSLELHSDLIAQEKPLPVYFPFLLNSITPFDPAGTGFLVHEELYLKHLIKAYEIRTDQLLWYLEFEIEETLRPR